MNENYTLSVSKALLVDEIVVPVQTKALAYGTWEWWDATSVIVDIFLCWIIIYHDSIMGLNEYKETKQ